MLSEQDKKIIEALGWGITESNDGYDIAKYSNAGEDFSFYVEKENAFEDIIDYCYEFDYEEHAESWLHGNGAPSMEVLLEDAKEIASDLELLADSLKAGEVLNPVEEKKVLTIVYHCNEWHERDSFRLIGMFEADKLGEAFRDIKKACNYTDEDFASYIHFESITLNEADI